MNPNQIPHMRTGFSQDSMDEWADDYIHQHLILLDVFMKDALRMAAHYCKSAGRHGIHANDINLAMMVRAFHGDVFWNDPNIQSKIQASEKDNMFYEAANETTNEEEEISQQEEPWTRSVLNDPICNAMNDLDQNPYKWHDWKPTSREMVSVKAAIEKSLEKALEYEINNGRN